MAVSGEGMPLTDFKVVDGLVDGECLIDKVLTLLRNKMLVSFALAHLEVVKKTGRDPLREGLKGLYLIKEKSRIKHLQPILENALKGVYPDREAFGKPLAWDDFHHQPLEMVLIDILVNHYSTIYVVLEEHPGVKNFPDEKLLEFLKNHLLYERVNT